MTLESSLTLEDEALPFPTTADWENNSQQSGVPQIPGDYHLAGPEKGNSLHYQEGPVALVLFMADKKKYTVS